MSGRESAAVERAVAEVLAHPERTLTAVAKTHGVAVASLNRALRRRGVPPREALRGAAAPGYIDGRHSQRSP